jgi:hypothetical protein
MYSQFDLDFFHVSKSTSFDGDEGKIKNSRVNERQKKRVKFIHDDDIIQNTMFIYSRLNICSYVI